MMQTDVVIAHPVHLDYPLFRQFVHKERSKFNKVIIVFTQMNAGKDYRAWLTEQFAKDDIITINNDAVRGDQDWRNVAVNKGLGMSDAEWVWFLEQDFFPQPGFFHTVIGNMPYCRVIGVKQEDRLHPCCLFIKRELLDSLTLDFGAVADKLDHFGLIQKQLEERQEKISIIHPEYWQHLNGLSQNMYLLQLGQQPNYEPEKFKDYCRKCLVTGIEIHPEIKELMEKYVNIQ